MKYIALLLLLAGTVHAQSAGPGGFYVIADPSQGGTAAANALAALAAGTLAPNVPINLRLNLQWDQLQDNTSCTVFPCSTYNWTTTQSSGHSIDWWLYQAYLTNTKIAIALGAGGNTPTAAAGVTVTCGTDLVSAAAPWDSTYLTNYQAALAQVATHLTAVNVNGVGPGTVNVAPLVRIVRLSGIDNTTAEFKLSYGTAPCAGGNGVLTINQAWATAGFTPAKIQNAFNTLVAAYVADFGAAYTGGVTFALDTIYVNAFPAVDNNGNVYSPPPGRTDWLTQTVVQNLLSNATYSGSKFSIQWDALDNTSPAPQPGMAVAYAASRNANASLSYQMNEHGGISGGTQCNYGGNAIATYTSGSPTLNLTNISGKIIAGTSLSNAGNPTGSGIPGTAYVSAFTPGAGQTGTATISTNTVLAGTNVPVSFTLFENCSNALISGNQYYDFELVIDTAMSLGAKWIEFWGANMNQAPLIQTVVANIQAKSMALPQ